MKLAEKEKAIALRKQGGSIKEIARVLGVAKSSASLWTRDVPLSPRARKILRAKFTAGQNRAQEVLRARTERRLSDAARSAEETLSHVSLNVAMRKVLCALLHWCEGRKAPADRELSFMNSDPLLVSAFLGLFRLSFDVDERKFRVCVHLHDYHNERKQLQFWSKITKIPLSQFMRPYRKPHTGKQIRDGYPGCAQVRYGDVAVAREVAAVARAFLRRYGSIG